MTPLLVKAYLLDHTFQQLEDEHGVCARLSADGSKLSLNYDQVLVKSGDPVAEQCRGLVVRPLAFQRLRTSADWKQEVVGHVEVVAWPMNRFYNAGDAAAAEVDWSDTGLRVYEKLDGTMIVMYFDHLQDRWCAGTRGVCEADMPIRLGDMSLGTTTFSDLFWKALWITAAAQGAYMPGVAPSAYEACRELMQDFDRSLTYVFELTGPHNRVVVRYNDPRVTLLAIRNTVTGEELSIEKHGPASLPRPGVWPIADLTALAAFVNAADPGKIEGAVVCDSRFRRLKVKNMAWVMSSRAKDLVTTSLRSGLEAVIQERLDDILPLLEKDVGDKLVSLRDAYKQFCLGIDQSFAAWHAEANGDRKAFALKVTGSKSWTPPFFNMWEGRAASCHEWVRSMSERGKLPDSSLDAILGKMQLPQSLVA
jgi:hypothetical protein